MMKYEVQNISMKVVGRRSPKSTAGLVEANVLLQTVLLLRGARGVCPRGVYRFTTHEEAYTWKHRMLAKSSLAAQQ